MYKLNNDPRTGELMRSVCLKSISLWIPFDPANTDYQTFKKDVAGGVELQDPDGNVMTQAEVDAFLKTIP